MLKEGAGGAGKKLTMVLVTDQYNCERIITAGRAFADMRGTELTVINIGTADAERNPDAIEHLFRVSRENAAVMSVYYSDDPLKRLTSVIREEAPQFVLSGMPRLNDSPMRKLWMRFDDVDFFTVDTVGRLHAVTPTDKIIA